MGSPYHVVPSTLKRHWQVLGKVKGTPFSKWELPAVVAWVEAELGECGEGGRGREREGEGGRGREGGREGGRE